MGFCSSLTLHLFTECLVTLDLLYTNMTMHDALTARFTDADEIQDVALYGCSGGVSGFIYISENEKFYDEYEDEILNYLNDRCMSMKDFVHDGSTIRSLKNDLVWAVVEAWCYAQHTVN